MHKEVTFEVYLNRQWLPVDWYIFRSFTGSRRKNGKRYTGPVYKLGTNLKA